MGHGATRHNQATAWVLLVALALAATAVHGARVARGACGSDVELAFPHTEDGPSVL